MVVQTWLQERERERERGSERIIEFMSALGWDAWKLMRKLCANLCEIQYFTQNDNCKHCLGYEIA